MRKTKDWLIVLPVIILLTTGALMANSAYGEIYRYQDANGKWHYTDKKPKPKQQAETLDIKKTAAAKYDKPGAYYQTVKEYYYMKLRIDNPFFYNI